MQHTLLLVDAHHDVLEAFKKTIEKEDIQVFTAKSVEEGLKYLNQNEIQLVIAEQHLPSMHGTQFLKHVKELYPETIRLMLCDEVEEDNVEDAINDGSVYKCLIKPWDNLVIRHHLNAAFEYHDFKKKIESPMLLEAEWPQALDNHEFVLYYQPLISLQSGQIVGAEALLRWQHPVRGLLYPEQFLYLGETSGLIVTLDAWVLRQAVQMLSTWRNKGFRDLFMAINLSARQFTFLGLRDLISKTLVVNKVPPSCIVFEITQALVNQHVELGHSILNNLHKQGIQLALDDFGSAYTSLNTLKHYPFNILKIDNRIIHDIGEKENNELLLSMVNVGKRLGCTIVAEGVEKPEQLNFLKEVGCDLFQGFLYSHALLPHEFLQRLSISGFSANMGKYKH